MITRHDKIDTMTKIFGAIITVMTVLAVVYMMGIVLG